MIVRYIFITILKWAVSYLAVGLALYYIVPGTLPVTARNIAVWALTSLIALVFAEWAFKPKMPVKKDIILLLVIWLVVTSVLSMGLDIIMWGKPIFLLKALDMKIQYGLELLMVCVAALISRKRRMAHATGEGMVA